MSKHDEQLLKLGNIVWEMITRTMNTGNPKDGAYSDRSLTFPTSDGVGGKVTLIICRDPAAVTAFHVAAAQLYSRVDLAKVDKEEVQ